MKDDMQKGDKYIIHWDEKKLKGTRHVDAHKEYMAVVVTNVITGNYRIMEYCSCTFVLLKPSNFTELKQVSVILIYIYR